MISPGSGMPRLSSPMTTPTSAYTATAGTVSSHSWTCNAVSFRFAGPVSVHPDPGVTVGKPTGSRRLPRPQAFQLHSATSGRSVPCSRIHAWCRVRASAIRWRRAADRTASPGTRSMTSITSR